MKNNNIVLFSSGLSEESGLLGSIKMHLEEKGYVCFDWKGLFASARDTDHIALLPLLIKKIPTFDYAVLICEGHDTTYISRGTEPVATKTMRDNVLFEIGLCAMALGLNRTVLLTDRDVRLPDDLQGRNGQLAVKQICFPLDFSAQSEDERVSEIERICQQIDGYIRQTGEQISQIVIGAAASGACGYVSNFICRTLEHIDDEICLKQGNETQTIRIPLEKVYMHIMLPDSIDEQMLEKIRQKNAAFIRGTVPKARNRPADFSCCFQKDQLHIIDYPTNIATSYDTARIILNMEADDVFDAFASARFTAKELNLFEATVKALLNKDFVEQVISEHYPKASAEQKRKLVRNVWDVMEKRLTITRQAL